MLEDTLLIWKFKRGNVNALQQIYDKYKGDLLKLAIALSGDVCLAEDVVQDVFVKLAEAHDKISIHGNLKNYLITCLVNRIRSLRRDEQRRQAKAEDASGLGIVPMHRPDQWAVVVFPTMSRPKHTSNTIIRGPASVKRMAGQPLPCTEP